MWRRLHRHLPRRIALLLDADELSREKVLLYLVITMLPFAVVAPILGPALDYRRSGRRVLVLVSMLGRAVPRS